MHVEDLVGRKGIGGAAVDVHAALAQRAGRLGPRTATDRALQQATRIFR